MTVLRINLLGEFSATLDDGTAIPIKGRKAQALLALLVMSPDMPVSRDRIVGLLWSDRGDEQARGSLRQALSELRRALERLDPSPLNAERESVQLDAGNVICDAVLLEQLAQDGSEDAHEQVGTLYKGPFLDSLGVIDPAFEEWLDGERARLGEIAHAALLRLLTAQQSGQKNKEAISTARHLLSLDPLREDVHRALMQLYSDDGNRAMALKQFQTCRDVLRAELGVEPEETTTQLRDAISGQTETLPSPAELALPAEESLPLPDKPSIAVLPFINMSGDAEQEYFADGITEDIITALSRFSQLFVIARTSSFSYKGVPVDVRTVGEELGVRYVVEGSVRKAGNRVRITVQLIEAATGNHLWAERYDRNLEDIFAVQDEITGAVASAVGGLIDAVIRKQAMKGSKDFVESYDLTLRGTSYLWTFGKEDNFRAEALFLRAIELDPDNILAHLRLASAMLQQWLSFWKNERDAVLQRALDHGLRGVDIDSNNSRARWALGEVYQYMGNYDEARYHMDASYKLNPNDVECLCIYGYFLASQGEFDAGLDLFDSAARLDPLDTNWRYWLNGISYFLAQRYDDAISMLTRIVEPIHEADAWLAASYGHVDRTDEAREILDRFLDRSRQDMVNFPGTRVEDWQEFADTMGVGNTKTTQRFLDGLRKAGLED